MASSVLEGCAVSVFIDRRGQLWMTSTTEKFFVVLRSTPTWSSGDPSRARHEVLSFAPWDGNGVYGCIETTIVWEEDDEMKRIDDES